MREADVEVPDLLACAMEELDLPYFGWDDPRSKALAAAALAREHVDGRLPARDLCRMIHERFGHQAHDMVEPLAMLDDWFDTMKYSQNPTEEQLERRTALAAAQLMAYVDDLSR